MCSGEGLSLNDVTAIDTAGLTPEEQRQQHATLGEFYERLGLMLQTDAHIAVQEVKNQDLLEYIVGLRSSSKPGKPSSEAHADAVNMLGKLEGLATQQKHVWENLKMPDRIFVVLRDIKNLQYTVRILAYQEWRMYLQHGDLTLREYAREHYRQVQVFETRFQEHLKEIRSIDTVGTGKTGDSSTSEPEPESSEPEPVIIPELPE